MSRIGDSHGIMKQHDREARQYRMEIEAMNAPDRGRIIKRIQLVETPTGAISLVRPVAAKLLAEGIISGELDGKLTAGDALTVKAAVMSGAGVCDFCSAPGPSHDFDVPDFEMGVTGLESTGGWAACEDCSVLIKADRRKDLLKRSMEGMAFSKFTKGALEELHGKFWKAMEDNIEIAGLAKAIADTVHGTIPADIDAQFPDRLPDIPLQIRRASVKREFNFTDEELDLVMRGSVTTSMARRMVEWKKSGKSALLPELVKQRPPTPPDLVPHWQKALDGKFAALSELSRMIHKAHSNVQVFNESTDLTDPKAVAAIVKQSRRHRELLDMGFVDDVKHLREAQAYSFNAETIAAIREASQSIPLDSPLSAIETPHTGAGWFWFAEPLPIRASPLANDKVHALLWAWEQGTAYELNLTEELIERMPQEQRNELAVLEGKKDGKGAYRWTGKDIRRVGDILKRAGFTAEELEQRSEKVPGVPAICFSAYVIDEKGQYLKAGTPSPSTRFFWRFDCSLEEMIELNGHSWDREYGPGAEHEHDPYVMGREHTLTCVRELALFFAMACVWFKQTVPVLTREPGHIERHARKRMARDHKLDEPPTVQVVALRRSARVASGDAPSERQDGAREYHCRWIVKGHPRLQAYGPQRKERKLIWIEAHVAGPDDKPLRTREKVFAVIR